MANTITNMDDVIDSRDVIERIEELEDIETLTEAEFDELNTLKALAEEASGYAADWQYGEALIRESYFEQYMDEMVEDCYSDVVKMAKLPCFMSISIDYDMLKQDYTEVDFDGVTYYIR